MKRNSFLITLAAMVAVPFALTKSKPKELSVAVPGDTVIRAEDGHPPEKPYIFRHNYLISKEEQENFRGQLEFLEKRAEQHMNEEIFHNLIHSGQIRTGKIIHPNGDIEIMKLLQVRQVV